MKLFEEKMPDVNGGGEESVVSKIHHLPRPSPQYPRRYVPVDFDAGDWNQIETLYKELLDRPIGSVEELKIWLEDASELGAVIGEEGSRRYITMTCDTTDEKAKEAYLYFIEEISPKLKPFGFELDKKLLATPQVSDLDDHYYLVLLRNTRNQVELFRPENVPLETELDKLSQQYQEIQGAMTVVYQGKEMTLQQMGIFLEDINREIRREAWELINERRLKEAERLDELFTQMVKIRHQIALNAGFDNYRDYMFRAYNRFDYTPEDCFSFHQAVQEYVVPLTRHFLEERKASLALEAVKPWDISCDRLGRPPLRPFKSDRELVEGCQTIFSRIDPRLGEQFQLMRKLGLLDLGSRKGKAPGGYQSTLSEVRLPFIFMNAVGTNRDVMTLLHEGGHAFHSLAASHHPFIAYRHAPIEFAEVASMGMEHLGADHLEVFYSHSDAARARRDHLEADIGLLPWIAIVDAFQHWIYTHPEHSTEERARAWEEIYNRFSAGVDWSGQEEGLRYRWQAQLHIFEYPFYYIEYGIALLGALQVWKNSLEDGRGAIDAYLKALSLGGSRPLPELFQTAGAQFDFSAATIRPLMDMLGETIERQGALETR